MAGDRRPAGAVERGEEGALAASVPPPSRDRRSAASSASTCIVARTALDADRTLPRRRRKRLQRQQFGDDIGQAEPLQPGKCQQCAVDVAPLAACAAACRHCRGTARPSRSGRMRRISAWRRSDEVPTVAPCGRSAMLAAVPADEGVARDPRAAGRPKASARRAAPSACPSTNARRCRCGRRASASSISLVNRPLPPASASAGPGCGRRWS